MCTAAQPSPGGQRTSIPRRGGAGAADAQGRGGVGVFQAVGRHWRPEQQDDGRGFRLRAQWPPRAGGAGGGASVGEQQTMSLGRPFRLPTPCLLTTQPVGAALLRAFRKASAQPSESSTTGLGGALRKGPSWSLPTGLYLPPLPAEPHGGPRADTRSPLCTPRCHAITHPPPPGKHAPRTLPPPARFPPGSKAAAFTLEKGPLNVAGQGLAASSGHVEKPRLCPASCTTPASTLHF